MRKAIFTKRAGNVVSVELVELVKAWIPQHKATVQAIVIAKGKLISVDGSCLEFFDDEKSLQAKLSKLTKKEERTEEDEQSSIGTMGPGATSGFADNSRGAGRMGAQVEGSNRSSRGGKEGSLGEVQNPR